MFLMSIPDDTHVQDFIESRRRSARPFGTSPSLTIAVIEKTARLVRAGAARVERWAHGSENAAPDAMPLPLPR